MRPGSLIVFEGLDGSGISTQAKRLAEHKGTRGVEIVHTQQPSEGPVGAVLKEMLASDGVLGKPVSLRTLSLLFAADRTDHLQRVVEPALDRGAIVICERWYLSSLAYQRTGVDRDWITSLNAHARRPNITVFLQVRPEVARQRRVTAGRTDEYFHQLSTQKDVEAGYRVTIAELKAEGERIEIVDGEKTVDAVFAAVLEATGGDAASTQRSS